MLKSLRFVFVAPLVILLGACTHEQSHVTTVAPTLNLAPTLDPIVHQLDSSGAMVSARILDLETGKELYAVRPDEPMIPASNMKLQTTAAAVDRFGPDHVFKTYLAMDGDDLWLIGTGDPSCGDSKIEAKYGRKTTSMLDDWADALKKRGITQIKGKLLFYDGTFDTELVEHSWSKSFLTDWYAAPVSGLNFNDNSVDIAAIPTNPGEPVKLEVVPPTEGNKIVNNATTAEDGAKETVDIERDKDSNTFVVSGKAKSKKELASKPVTDPGAFFADALRTNLKSHGIEIAGPTERAPKPLGGSTAPPADKIVATHESKFADVLTRLNKNSQNLFAEALSKYQGRAYALEHGQDVPGSWKLGGDAVHAFLQKNKIDDSKFVYVDGSGLARGNHVTTRLISDELAVMHRHPYHDVFFNSLPIGGKDGTIGKRMTDISGHVFAKTGFIGGVRSLSGYVKTRENKWLVFSVLFDKLPGSVAPAEDVQDNVCRVLVEYPNVENAKLKGIRPATTQAD